MADVCFYLHKFPHINNLFNPIITEKRKEKIKMKESTKNKAASKTIAFALLTAMLIASIFTVFPLNAAAAVAFPGLGSNAYCEFKATKTIPVYRDSSLGTRGTSNPYSSYNAEIWSGDICQIIEITSSYIILKYPTSSGLRTGYIRRSDLINVSAPLDKVTAKGSATTNTKAANAYYGYTETGDTVFRLGAEGSYTAIIYSARSGSRAYKFGYVLTSEYNSKIAPGGGTGSFNPVWPTEGGRITSGDYHPSGNKHSCRYAHGVDINVSYAKIYSIESGTVTEVTDKGNTSYGKFIVVRHDNGAYSLYAHLSAQHVRVGDRVSRGQCIGVSGNSGASTGAHLHFELSCSTKDRLADYYPGR